MTTYLHDSYVVGRKYKNKIGNVAKITSIYISTVLGDPTVYVKYQYWTKGGATGKDERTLKHFLKGFEK